MFYLLLYFVFYLFLVLVGKVKRRRKQKIPVEQATDTPGESLLKWADSKEGKKKKESFDSERISCSFLNLNSNLIRRSNLSLFVLLLVLEEEAYKPSKRPLSDAAANKGQQPKKRRRRVKDADKEVSLKLWDTRTTSLWRITWKEAEFKQFLILNIPQTSLNWRVRVAKPEPSYPKLLSAVGFRRNW